MSKPLAAAVILITLVSPLAAQDGARLAGKHARGAARTAPDVKDLFALTDARELRQQPAREQPARVQLVKGSQPIRRRIFDAVADFLPGINAIVVLTHSCGWPATVQRG
jgi:hypothetical protein